MPGEDPSEDGLEVEMVQEFVPEPSAMDMVAMTPQIDDAGVGERNPFFLSQAQHVGALGAATPFGSQGTFPGGSGNASVGTTFSSASAAFLPAAGRGDAFATPLAQALRANVR